jgi:hypothetical protein
MNNSPSATNHLRQQSQCYKGIMDSRFNVTNLLWTGLKSTSGLIGENPLASRLYHSQTQGYNMLVRYIR